jgi:hypothetical protein
MAMASKIRIAVKLAALFAIAVLAATAAFAAQTGVKVTSLVLEDGSEVILNPDSTWSYKSATLSPDVDDDVYMELKDNRVLWLRSDYTYTFVKSKPPKSNRPKSYPQVDAVATATVQSLDVATKTAVNQVYDKVASSLGKYVMSKDKKAKDYLLACIKDRVKDNELEQVYVQTKAGWKADAKVSIPGYKVKEIIDCLDTQLAPAEEEAAVKEAEKKKK